MNKTTLGQNAIPVDEVTVQERQVTVRVLTIGTKQITQAFYQQIMNSHNLVEEDGEMADWVNIWGWVNVCTPICKHLSDSHIHVVYEEGGVLKKDRVSKAIFAPETLGSDLKEYARKYKRDDPRVAEEYEKQIKEYIDRWNQTFETIEAAGQLFIAVSGVWK